RRAPCSSDPHPGPGWPAPHEGRRVSSTTVPHLPQDPPAAPARFAARFSAVVDNVERVVHGKRRTAHRAVVCLLAEGHLLIEDVPGVGKTSLAKALARSIDGTWHRVQFTPDLLPSDVTGVSVWNRAMNDFEFRAGAVFAHI